MASERMKARMECLIIVHFEMTYEDAKKLKDLTQVPIYSDETPEECEYRLRVFNTVNDALNVDVPF